MVNQRILWLTCICHIVSVLLFMCGYFPSSSFKSSGMATSGDRPETEPGLNQKVDDTFYRRHVGKVVLIVIDALRADFVFDRQHHSSMPYLQNLLANKQAFGVTARAQPPTVTLPRIKAMTTGTVPGYVDVVMNFGAPELNEDSILYQLRKNGLKSVFYGDDTWIRLFPTSFERKEGTTSFFVTDFKEVDDNVTRHLNSELQKNDWDMLILHYLGLDHMGHVVGPKSPIIASKLEEMDNVIKQVHGDLMSKTSTSSARPLVIICGDHGMNDAGSHGGSSTKETEIPLVFTLPLNDSEIKILPKFDNVNQVDLTASLAMLLGLPIPKNNLGKIVPALLSSFDWRQRLYLTYANAFQLQKVAERSGHRDDLDTVYLHLQDTKIDHRKWLNKNCSSSDECVESAVRIAQSYYNIMSAYGSMLISSSVNYDHWPMVIAVAIQWLTLLLATLTLTSNLTSIPSSFSSRTVFIGLVVFVFMIRAAYYKTFGDSFMFNGFVDSNVIFITSFLLFTLLVNELWSIIRGSKSLIFHQQKAVRCAVEMLISGRNFYLNLWCVSSLFLHSVSLASSSFVEEEHYTWYFLTSSTILVVIYLLINKLSIDCTRKSDYARQIVNLIAVLLLFRVGRNWNSTGDHWAHLDDIGDWFNTGERSEILLSIAITIGLVIVSVIRIQFHRTLVKSVLVIVTVLFIYIYKTKILLPTLPSIMGFNLIPSNYIARAVFVLNGVICVCGLSEKKRSDKIGSFLHGVNTFWLLTALLLCRPHNVLWLALIALQEYLLANTKMLNELSVESAVLLRLFMAKSSFFQQGNSNNLARIDLVGGYVGLDNYHPTIIGVLLTCSTYSSSLFWLSSICSHIYVSDPQRFSRNLLKASLVLITTQALIWSFYTVFVFILRYHLFVWTVFSPKLLFEGAFSVIIIFIACYCQLLKFMYHFFN